MSVTFTPAAGTTTTYVYYDGSGDELDCKQQNGILRLDYESPSTNYTNSRASELMRILSFGSRMIHEDGSEERILYGSIPAHRCKKILHDIVCLELPLTPDMWDEFKLHDFVQVLRHCQYHDCDLRYS
jgi:hypothetical protein